MKMFRRLTAVLLAIVVFAGYMPLNTVEAKAAAKKVDVKSLKLSKTQYVLKKGETLKLKATISPSKAKSVKVTWKSSNKKAVTVNSKGVVKANAKKGKATITAKAGSKKATCKITIGSPVTNIKASNMTVNVGKSKQITVTLTPKKPTVKTLAYSSSNKKVATVSKSGKVTGKKAGTAKITITASDREKIKKVIKVTVKKAAAPVILMGIELDKRENRLYVGEDWTPEVTYTPSNAANKSLKWSSSDENVAKVDEKTGKVSALSLGNCVITAVSEADSKVTASCNITVKFKMALEQTNVNMEPGEIYAAKLNFTPDTVQNQSVTWSSSDSNVASVISSDGKIKALTPGECEIVATSVEDGSEAASCTVTVGQDGIIEKTVSGQSELLAALSEAEGSQASTVLTLATTESNIHIPSAVYENVTLEVNAPNAHIENEATFKDVLVKEISDNTWVEKVGNRIFMNASKGGITVDSNGNPNLYLLDSSEAVTVTNNGNLQELLIASAAKVLVKGDSVAGKVNCNIIGGGTVTTYIPLDIYSTTKYRLIVGPGGEQTAIKADKEENVPEVSGIGTLSVTIDSTGENRTVIAENDGSLTDIPMTAICGKVVDENQSAVQSKVYLVAYSKEVNGENISVYLNGAKTKKTDTDSEGLYEFGNVEVGNYILVVEAEGYELLTQNAYIPASYGDMVYELDEVVLLSGLGQPGGISGILKDAETGNPVSKGLTVILRKGMNNITSNAAETVVSDENGKYSFDNVIPGQYTIQVRDNSDTEEYVASYYNISVLSGTIVTKNITMSKALNSREVRFVLTWDGQGEGVSPDLDIHMYGPDPYNDSEYGIYFGDGNRYESGYDMNNKRCDFANLDVDDKEYEGPETITVKNVFSGQYKIFVVDYTNGGSGSSLAVSNPVIKVYVGNTLTDTIKMPSKSGGVWYACNYDGSTGKLAIVNDVYSGKPNTTVRAKIATIFNEMEQFEVTDAAAFAKYQSVLDIIKSDYLKQQDEVKLQEYYNQVKEVVDAVKAGLTMSAVLGEGVNTRIFYGFEGRHSINLYGSAESMPTLTVNFADVAKGSEYKQDGNCLTINNPVLGISTKYYLYYSKTQEYDHDWVRNIQDPDNTGWKTDICSSMAYLGGMNAELGKNLKVSLLEGIELESVTYKTDVNADSWNYGDKTDAVLHLKKTSTGETKEYTLNYIPLGIKITDVKDNYNVITEVDSSISWEYEDSIARIWVYGENSTLGTTWKPILEDGATARIEYPAEIADEYFDGDARITVTNQNGGIKVYCLYYYQNTSEAEIIGIRDKNNMFTGYYISSAYRSQGREYYNIEISGTNSVLGENLEVYTRPGATAKVEYATSSVSWESESSDAKITVTADSGVERIYYIIYKKSTSEVNIRGIDSDSNMLKNVCISSGDEIYITGTKEILGTDLKIQTNSGFTAEYREEDNKIYITNTATGEENYYYVYYTQDGSSVKVKTITSRTDDKLACVVDSWSQNITTDNGSIRYYEIELTGNYADCPEDLNAKVPVGSKAEITYAKNTDIWIYGSSYVAKVEVTGADDITRLYLVTYEQDDRGAVVSKITDEKNAYSNMEIETYEDKMYYKEEVEGASYEEVYRILVEGNNASLGNSYKLEIPEGSTIEGTTHKGDAEWNYYRETYSSGFYNANTYTYEDRVVVRAANGATRIYVIAYRQDDRGAMVSGISDEKNEYLNTEIQTNETEMYYKEEVDGASYEEVYMILVEGNDASLGNSYKLEIPEGSTIESTTHKGDAEWNYYRENCSGGYDNENGEYVRNTYTYEDRVVVRAANGATRIYVIAYHQDDRGTIVSGIKDEKNEYLNTKIQTDETEMDYKKEVDGASYEEVYRILVEGNNASLGNSYKLEIPEGSTIESTTHKGDAEWNYDSETCSDGYYNEKGEYVRNTYTYEDRVVVKAANGATRIYVIAYHQDDRGTIVSGITDENNVYSNTKVEMSEYSMYCKEEVNGSTYEEVYRIFVEGNNASLGNSYKLEIPEGSTIESTTHKGDAEWNYYKETCSYGDYNEKDEYVGSTYTYEDRVVVKAANGATRIYVIAYRQDDRNTIVSGISDEKNEYLNTEIQTDETEMDYKEEVDGASYEEVYRILVEGNNASLGNSYKLEIPEGSTIANTTHKGDAEWNYDSETCSGGYLNEKGEYVRNTYTYEDRVVVKAANGATRIYVIAYHQDDRSTIVSGITDENNVYSNTEVEMSECIMSFKEEVNGSTYEKVYRILVEGNNASLGNGYKLEIPEGSTIESTTHKGDAEWNYYKETYSSGYYNEKDEYVRNTYTYEDRVVVKAANGAVRIYVIAYAQKAVSET